MSFHVGQKVVCVDASPGGMYGERTLVRDRVYIVDGISDCGRGVLISAAPTRNPSGWWRTRFRPVIERKTDIAIFTALLNPANHKYRERVDG